MSRDTLLFWTKSPPGQARHKMDRARLALEMFLDKAKTHEAQLRLALLVAEAEYTRAVKNRRPEDSSAP